MTMLPESEYEVAADGTVTLRGLEPGRRVRVAVRATQHNVRNEMDVRLGMTKAVGHTYRPELPRTNWGEGADYVSDLERPFDPAVDPEDWEVNR